MNIVEVDTVVGAEVPARDAEGEQVEVGRQNNWMHRRTFSVFFPGLL